MHAGKIRWDQAGPYLLLHGPEYAGDADRADEVLTDAEFLVHAEPITLLPLLDKACEEDAALAASVYAASSDWHQYLEPDARRRALAIDAAAFGARDLASRLAQPLRWLPTWTSGVNVHKGLSKTGFFLGYNPGPRARQIIRLGSRWVLLAHDPGGRHGELQVWDLTTGRPVGRSFADDVTAVATTQLHRRTVAVSGGRDGKLIVWNLASRQPLDLPLQGSGEVIAVSCIRRGKLALAVSAHATLTEEVVWDSATGRLKETLPSDELWEQRVVAGSYNSDTGSWSASISDPSELRQVTRLTRNWTLRVWDLPAGQATGDPIPMDGGPVDALACILLNGRAFAVTGSRDGTLRTWDLTAGGEAGDPIPVAGGPVHALACTLLNGRAVAVIGSQDGTLQICDLAARQQVGASLDSGPTIAYYKAGRSPVKVGPVYEITCTQLNRRMVAVSGSHDGMVRVWDLASREILDTIPLVRTAIVGLAAAPTGDLVAGTAIAMSALRWK